MYEVGIILCSILRAKPGDLVPTEDSVSEEPVLLMPHQSQEFSMALSGQDCGKDGEGGVSLELISGPSRATTTSTGKSSP